MTVRNGVGYQTLLDEANAMRLGLQRTSHLEGGFGAWKDAGFEIVPLVSKAAQKEKR